MRKVLPILTLILFAVALFLPLAGSAGKLNMRVWFRSPVMLISTRWESPIRSTASAVEVQTPLMPERMRTRPARQVASST